MINIDRLSQLAVERTVTAVDPLATPPATPVNLSATGRNLGILIQWSRVDGADGYNLIINSTQDLSKPEVQIGVSGENTTSYSYNVGNLALTRYVAIQSVKGSSYSALSTPVTVSTSQAVATSSFPGDTTYTDVETQLATVTLTTTGQTLLVIGSATLSHDGSDRGSTLTLYEDGLSIRVVKGNAKDNATGHGWQFTCFNFTTPAAGSHTYVLKVKNDVGNDTCTAASIGLIAAEIPLLTSAAAIPAAPSIPVAPPAPTDYLTGAEKYYGR